MDAKIKIHLAIAASVSGFFLLADQWLKYLALSTPSPIRPFGTPWLGWELYKNPGIALSVPFPNWLIVVLTPIILLVLTAALWRKKTKTFWYVLGVEFILLGAVSNYIDRVLFSATIDYLRILTSVINLADAMIVGGALLVFFQSRKTKTS